MLKQLSLEGFKSWNEISNMRLNPITGLFGVNSSGKTSILQFLLMLKQTAESPDRTQIFDFGNEKSLVSLSSFENILRSYEEEVEVLTHNGKPRYRRGKVRTRKFKSFFPLKWELQWVLPSVLKIYDPSKQKHAVLFSDENMAIQGEIKHIIRHQFRVSEIKYEFSGHEFGMRPKPNKSKEYDLFAEPNDFRFVHMRGRAWGLPAPAKCYGFPDQVRAYYKNAEFLSKLELEYEEMLRRIYYLGPLRQYPQREYTWVGGEPADMGQRGEKAVEALLASSKREKISRGRGMPMFSVEEYVAYWLKKLDLICDFNVKRIARGSNLYQVLVKKSPKATPVRITDVGFGVSQILPVLAICYYVPEGSIILLEQPEIHLHPSVQSGLADVFIDAVKKRNIQIIVESHSEHLLKRLQRRIAEKKLSKDNTALYFCNIADGVSRLTNLDLDIFGNITNWPKNFFGDSFGEMAATTKAIMECKRKQQG
jgi:predicted ATPase